MVIAATPLGVLLCFIGLLFDRYKRPAVVGLLLAGATIAVFFLAALC